jgi:hypothetical protein
MKTLIALTAALILSGCATMKCNGDEACIAAERENARAALFMMGMGMQQNAYRPPAYMPTPAPQPRVQQPPADPFVPKTFDPQRGTQYCNSQGLCMWKRN